MQKFLSDRISSEPNSINNSRIIVLKSVASSRRANQQSFLPTISQSQYRTRIIRQLSKGIDPSVSSHRYIQQKLKSQTSKIIKKQMLRIPKNDVQYFQSKLEKVKGKFDQDQDRYEKLKQKIRSYIQKKKQDDDKIVSSVSSRNYQFKQTMYNQRKKNRLRDIHMQRYGRLKNPINQRLLRQQSQSLKQNNSIKQIL